jgi:uncharacterized protein (DUF1697 family)
MAMATRHVALIRGINVGRAKRVAMADLQRLMEKCGYREVRTLLNSGNVVFTSPAAAPSRMGERIQRAMARTLGVSARVAVLTAAAFSTVVEENPLRRVASDPSRLLVVFGGDAEGLKRLRPLTRRDWSPGALGLGRFAAYLWCPDGILAAPLPEEVGRVLGDTSTARNWATVLRIHAAL